MRGLGDQHLKVILRRISEQYHVEVDTHPPSIPYKETILAAAEGHHRHKKQTGGAGQFGEVFLRIKPLERGSGLVFKNDTVGGSIPGQFIPAIEKGIQQALEEGAVAGYPLQDIEVSVYDGKFHAVDSKEIAFVTAGKKAFLDAVDKARPAVLEPIVKIQIIAPNNNMGDLAGDLSTKRGRISGSEALNNNRVAIMGEVPLAELDGYDARLKSITGGEGTYSIDFSHYDPVPGNIQKDLAAAYERKED
jgi:elongation factor G